MPWPLLAALVGLGIGGAEGYTKGRQQNIDRQKAEKLANTDMLFKLAQTDMPPDVLNRITEQAGIQKSPGFFESIYSAKQTKDLQSKNAQMPKVMMDFLKNIDPEQVKNNPQIIDSVRAMSAESLQLPADAGAEYVPQIRNLLEGMKNKGKKINPQIKINNAQGKTVYGYEDGTASDLEVGITPQRDRYHVAQDAQGNVVIIDLDKQDTAPKTMEGVLKQPPAKPQQVSETEWISRAAKGDPEAQKVVDGIKQFKKDTRAEQKDRFVTGQNATGEMVIINLDKPEETPRTVGGALKQAPAKPAVAPRDRLTTAYDKDGNLVIINMDNPGSPPNTIEGVSKQAPQKQGQVSETEWLRREASGDPEAVKVIANIKKFKEETKATPRDRFVTGNDAQGNMVIVNVDQPNLPPKIVTGEAQTTPTVAAPVQPPARVALEQPSESGGIRVIPGVFKTTPQAAKSVNYQDVGTTPSGQTVSYNPADGRRYVEGKDGKLIPYAGKVNPKTERPINISIGGKGAITADSAALEGGKYLLSGKLPFTGMSGVGRPQMINAATKIAKEHGWTPNMILRMQADYRSMDKSVSSQRKNYDAMNGFVINMDKQMNRLETAYKNLPRSQYRLLNIPLVELRQRAIGSGDEARAAAILIELGNESGKLSTNSAASIRELSESAQKQWAKIHDNKLSFTELKKVLETTRGLGHDRLNSTKEAMDFTLDGIENLGTGTQGTTSPPLKTDGKKVGRFTIKEIQ